MVRPSMAVICIGNWGLKPHALGCRWICDASGHGDRKDEGILFH